jgi:predicted esterase
MTVSVYACLVRFSERLRVLPLRRLWVPALCALTLTYLSLGFAGSVAAAPFRPSAVAPKAHAHVYLIRGFLNIFSLGMDEMAAKLRRQGVYVTVHNHLAWPLIANQAAEEYKSGKVRTIILVGHSAGADAVASICGELGEQGIPVKLAIGLDPGLSRTPASGHVDRYINFYVSTGIGHTIDKTPQFRGHFENVDVANMPGVGHFNIEKNAEMERIVIRDIDAAL